jgi:hypothetical protein
LTVSAAPRYDVTIKECSRRYRMAIKYNSYGEPMPVRLVGAIGRAWQRVLTANEWFDGEDSMQYSAQQRLLREWAANAPSTAYWYDYQTRETHKRDFGSRRAAESWLDAHGIEDATVRTT